MDQTAVGDLQPVEPSRDERGQRLRDGERREIAGRDVDASTEREPALRDEHAHRLHRVQRDPIGPGHDGPGGCVREAGHEPRQQVAHRALGQRLQVDAREIPLAGPPVGALVEELRPGQRHDEDRDVPAPLHHVVDEIDKPAVGVVEVLEDHRHRALRGEPLEERPPGAEELLRRDAGLQAEECQQGGLDPTPLVGVRYEPAHRLRNLRPGRRLVVALQEPASLADHLAEGPEADPLAVGRAASFVPPDAFQQAVHVLEELPGKARLPDARWSDHGHEPAPPFAARRVEQLLQEAELVLAPDEGRLQGLRPVPAAALGHDPHRLPGRNRRGLPLEHLLAGRLEGDRGARGPLGRLAHQHGPRPGNGLQPRRGVHQVAGDHSLAHGPERHRRLPRQHPGAGAERRTEGVDRIPRAPARPGRPARRRPPARWALPRPPSRRRR